MSTELFCKINRNLRNTAAELMAWYNGDENWGFHVKTPTKVLLRLYRTARYICTYTCYYEYGDCYESYEQNKTKEERLIERIRDSLKLALDNREHIHSKGGSKVLRKLMARHKLSKELAVVYAREHRINVS